MENRIPPYVDQTHRYDNTSIVIVKMNNGNSIRVYKVKHYSYFNSWERLESDERGCLGVDKEIRDKYLDLLLKAYEQ